VVQKGSATAVTNCVGEIENSPFASTCNDLGEFQFDSIPAGTWTLDVRTPDGATAHVKVTVKSSGRTDEVIQIDSPPPGAIDVTVSGGGTAAGFAVVAELGLVSFANAMGHYEFGKVPPGTYTVAYQQVGNTSAFAEQTNVVVTTAQTTTVMLTLPTSGSNTIATVEGKALRLGATNGDNGMIQVALRSDSDGSMVVQSTAHDGSYSFASVHPGIYRVTAAEKGATQPSAISAIIVVADGGTSSMVEVVEVPPIYISSGTVSDLLAQIITQLENETGQGGGGTGGAGSGGGGAGGGGTGGSGTGGGGTGGGGAGGAVAGAGGAVAGAGGAVAGAGGSVAGAGGGVAGAGGATFKGILATDLSAAADKGAQYNFTMPTDVQNLRIASDGNIVLMVWQQQGSTGLDIYDARYDIATGQLLDSPPATPVVRQAGDDTSPLLTYDGHTFVLVFSSAQGLETIRISGADNSVDVTPVALSTFYGLNMLLVGGDDGTSMLVGSVSFAENGGTLAGLRLDSTGSAMAALDTATVSLTADGMVGGPRFGNTQTWPSMVYTGSGRYFLVWQDLRNGDADIYGNFVTANHTTAPTLAFTADRDYAGGGAHPVVGDQQTPSVAWNGTSFMLAWQDDRNDSTATYYSIYGTPLDAAGDAPTTSGVALTPGGGALPATLRQYTPALSPRTDGTFLMVWEEAPPSATTVQIQAGIVDPASLGNTTPIELYPTDGGGGVAYLGVPNANFQIRLISLPSDSFMLGLSHP
jgi:hypothetical protein